MNACRRILRLFSILLAVVILVGSALVGVFAIDTVTAEFAGGTGTAEDPYLIETKEHLNNVRKHLDAHYKMTGDIIFKEADFAAGGLFYNDGNGWEPITSTKGTFVDSFSGSFDGNHHYIEGLRIYGESLGYIGLFGDVSGEIKNLEMRATAILLQTNKTVFVGCLTGSASNATISNCKTQGEIIIKSAPAYDSAYVGGICGRMAWTDIIGCTSDTGIISDGAFDRTGGICALAQEGAISKSLNHGQIKGTYEAGGICADTINTTISACGNFGNIQSTGFSGVLGSGSYADYAGEAGGIAAHSNSSDAVSDCFNSGAIVSDGIAGGMIGYAGGVAVKNCYNAGSVSAGIHGGMIGWKTGASLEHCYFVDTTPNAIGYGSQPAGAVKCTQQQFKMQETFVGFGFEATWELAEGNFYPYPTLIGTDSFVISETGPFNAGSGTKESPYCIASAKQLDHVRDYLDAHFKLVRDIVFTDSDFGAGGMFANGGQGWLPIGTDQTAPFTGTFDGGNHTIWGLHINITAIPTNGEIFAGLFGYGSGCTITNLYLKGTHLYVDAEGASVSAGGIIGYNSGGSVTRCSNAGNITVNTAKYAAVGGIAGCNDGANTDVIIDQCYNTATISAPDSGSGVCGGVAGDNYHTVCITNCFNTGNIISGSGIGGIIGYSHHSDVSVKHCYNIGVLASSGFDEEDHTNISGTYYLDIPVGETNEVTGCAPGIGLNGTEMKTAESFLGFDFADIWTMDGNPDYPYPELKASPMPYQRELLDLSILSAPSKTTYFENEPLDVTGGILLLRYTNNVRDVIDISVDMVTGFENQTAGDKRISVSYGGFVDSFTVTVLHKYSSVIVAPSCTEQGFTTHICACGDRYIDTYQDPLGHRMGEWSTIKMATCTETGTKRRECTRCYHAETNIMNASGHALADWTVVTEPSVYGDGEERRNCNHCKYFESREVPFDGNVLTVQASELLDVNTVWIDGTKCTVALIGDTCRIVLPEGEVTNMVSYSYNINSPEDIHTQYPTGMRVWRLIKSDDGTYCAEYVKELDNILQYSGSSIRITGTKGIRMITSMEKAKKQALTGGGLAGYKLMEYGTALCWARDLEEGKPMTLGDDYVKSNYAYKLGVADPVFAQTDTAVQYTNVLIGFDLDQCRDDIAMRPYMVLEDSAGAQITVYGGIVYRSIGYIAYQNRNVFSPGNAAYDYVWQIIHHVYGDQYDADFAS